MEVLVNGHVAIQWQVVEPPPTEPTFNGFRVLHKIEDGSQNTPPNMPEVTPPAEASVVKMTESIQRMSYELMRHFNPAITPQKWTKIHDHDRAFTNFNGFSKSSDPRANYILGKDLTSPLPKYDKAQRVCGGTFIRGTAQGDWLHCIPGIHGIDANAPMPSLQTIISNNWYVYAVSVNSDFTRISHFPQGDGGPVVIPFIFGKAISFPLAYFERWNRTELPDPLKIYR
jgi:hypothetical protein